MAYLSGKVLSGSYNHDGNLYGSSLIFPHKKSQGFIRKTKEENV